jgi:hypothetical protein
MVTEECVRIVPVTTCREVIERVENKVTVPVCRYLREEEVRRVPYTFTRMMYEQHVREVPVRVCKMVPVRKRILMPRSVLKMVPGKKTVSMPQLVVFRQNYNLEGFHQMFLAGGKITPALQPADTYWAEYRDSYSFWKKQDHRISQWAYDKKRVLALNHVSAVEPKPVV